MSAREYKSRHYRSTHGKGEMWIVFGIAGAIAFGMVVVVIRLIDQTSTHVSDVKKTRVKLQLPVNFAPKMNAIEKQIRSDLKNRPDLREISYGKMELTKKCFSDIGKMKQLKVLDLSDATFEYEWLDELKNLRISELILTNTGVTDRGIEAIAKIPTLTRLNVSYSEVTDAGLLFLKDHPALNELKLDFSKVTNESAQTMMSIPALAQVNLYGTQIDGRGVAVLARKPNLRTISIGGRFVQFTASDLRPLKHSKSLYSLELDNFAVSDELMEEVSSFRNIVDLNLVRVPISEAGLMMVSAMKQLRNLRIDRCPSITQATIDRVRAKMKNCSIEFRTQAMINANT